MNISSTIGFLIAGGVLYMGVLHGAKDPLIFLDKHALILVVGGTLAASLIAFPWKQIVGLIDFLYFGVLFKRHQNLPFLVEEIRMVAYAYQSNRAGLRHLQLSHPFLLEGAHLLSQDILSRDEIAAVLLNRKQRFKWKYQQDAKVLNAIAKYPPAFGLLGASTGMIAMMTNLGGPGGTAAIGSAMAVALVATFWGIASANFILLPLADHAQRTFLRDQHLREMIIEGLLLIKDRAPDYVIAEKLRSMLDLDERQQVARPITPPPPAAASYEPPRPGVIPIVPAKGAKGPPSGGTPVPQGYAPGNRNLGHEVTQLTQTDTPVMVNVKKIG